MHTSLDELVVYFVIGATIGIVFGLLFEIIIPFCNEVLNDHHD